MITVTKIVSVASSGTAPYDYQWINNDPNCVESFSTPSGTSDNGIIQTTISFNSQECAEQADISLHVIDSKGCKATFDIAVGSPCDDLTSTGFSDQLSGLDLQLTALHTGVTSGATYQWTYDTSVFSLVSGQGTDVIKLKIKTDRPSVTSSPIYVTVTNGSGCQLTTQYTFQFCTPLAQNQQQVICVRQDISTQHVFCLQADSCIGEINWSTLDFSWDKGASPYFQFHEVDENGCITYSQNSLGPAGTYTATWTVEDVNSNTSSTGTFTVDYVNCGSPGSCITAPRYTRRLTCDEQATGTPFTVTLIDLDDIVVTSNCNPIWEEFEFIAVGAQVASGIGETASMTTAFGQVDFNADHEIEYTFTGAPSGTETVRWKLPTDEGDETGTVEVVIIFDCIAGPTANADAYCQGCESTPTDYDVLANDTGNINPGSIVITSYPPVAEGSLNVNTGAGTIQFVPAVGFRGVSTYDYKVANWSGIYSSSVTVTVTSDCAYVGTTTTTETCLSNETVYNLLDLLGGTYDTGGTWTITGAPSFPQTFTVDTVSGAYALNDPVGVDDTPEVQFEDGTTDTGSYEFTYSLTDGCSTQTQVVTINNNGVTIAEVANSCDYDYSIENPDTATSAWNATISADDIYVTEKVRFKVTKDCGTPSVISNTVITDTGTYMYTQASQVDVFTDLITVGGYLEDVKVYHWDGAIETAYVLDVSPTGSNLIGPAGTVSGGDLIFDGSNYALLGPRLDIVIKNAVANQISLAITDINVTCNVTAGGYFTIKTRAKHSPTGDWVAIKSTDSDINFDIDGSTPANATTVIKAVSTLAAEVLKQTYSTLCGDITGLALPSTSVIDTASSEYNSIILTAGVTMAISGGDGNPITVTCDERTLTATLTPTCSGTVSYLWSTGETTQVITTAVLGLYSVDVNCSEYSCTAEADITIS